MSGFSADWLALREPADHRARSATLAARLDAWLADRDPVRIVDLGCGTGSNLRWLAPRLARRQHWRLLDHDATLLDALPATLARWCAARGLAADAGPRRVEVAGRLRVDWRAHDLRDGLAAHDAAPVVTAAALADLVSRPWLRALAARCAAHASALLLGLDYDGRVRLDPADPVDAAVRDAVNHHQLRDKGFGPALGPGAGAAAAALLADHGYRVAQAPSDWCLGSGDGALQAALVDGWHDAAAQTGRLRRDALDRWREQRLAAIRGGRLSIRVGHSDLLALPPAARG